jgi:hypothetical protein
LKMLPVATLMQWLSLWVNAPKLEVPEPGGMTTNRFGGAGVPHRPGLGTADGPLNVSRLPEKDMASACANVAELMYSRATDNAVRAILGMRIVCLSLKGGVLTYSTRVH